MPSSLRSITRSLHHRNFRIYFIGQLVSLTGTWITSIASSWLVYRLTGSTLLLGTLTAAGLLPTIIVSPLAGVKIDQWDRRKVLIATQAGSMAQSLALAALTLSGTITVPVLFVLTLIQGIINGFDMPARQAFLGEIVDTREDLGNAIALNSSIFNAARLIGPAIGGFVISLSSEGTCFLIDGITYFAVLLSLFRIRTVAAPPSQETSAIFTGLLEGLTYAKRFTPIGALLLIVAATSLGVSPYISLLPAFARENLNGGPETLGVLMSFAGLGALAGSLYLASRSTIIGLGALIVHSGLTLFASLVALSLSKNLAVACPSVFLIGLSMILVLSSSNTILQTLVEPAMRGRIMSLYTSSFTGMVPLGSLAAGAIEGVVGLRWVIAGGGAVIFAAALVLRRNLPSLKEKAYRALAEREALEAAAPP